MVAETPSAVFHYLESDLDDTVTSRKTDTIFRAAKQDLLTLMRLDVSAPARLLHGQWPLHRWAQVGGRRTLPRRWTSCHPLFSCGHSHCWDRTPSGWGSRVSSCCTGAADAAGDGPWDTSQDAGEGSRDTAPGWVPITHTSESHFHSHLQTWGIVSVQEGLSPCSRHVRPSCVPCAHSPVLVGRPLLGLRQLPGLTLCFL